MAESDGTPAAGQPPRRPTISLPPRSSYESLFGGVGGGGGGRGSDVSPGPLTLVSSFFAEDPDSEVGSFSQLLAGAMSPPVRNPGGGVEGGVYRENRPVGLMVSQSPPIFSVPAGLSPASLLDSPAGFFSSGPGHFGISHQQALAQVTAQAVHAHSYSHLQVDHQSLPAAASATKFQTSDRDIIPFESAEDSQYDQKPQPTAIIVDKPADDGYNWRKYGQKQMKGSDYPRSYYKCTHPGCPVKKKVEHSSEGHVTEIIYKGQHSHQRPTANRRGKDFGTFSGGSNELNGNFDFPANSETVAQMGPGNYSRSGDTMPVPSTSKRDRESVNGTSEQLSESSDESEVGNAELGRNKGDPNIPDPQRRKIDTRVADSNSSQRTVAEPRIIVQTTSEVDLLDDGFRWRKYGQKVVKGNPNPRSYYKCTNVGCKVRKHVERASTDPKAVITTYEGKHNHEVPTARNSSHSTATAGAVSNSIQSKPQNAVPNNQHFFVRTEFRDNVQQLKEEHDAV